jgi:hypothetical protein
MSNTKCIEVEFPYDGRRKATIVTDDKFVCEYLAQHPDAAINISIAVEPCVRCVMDGEKVDCKGVEIKTDSKVARYG